MNQHAGMEIVEKIIKADQIVSDQILGVETEPLVIDFAPPMSRAIFANMTTAGSRKG